MQIKKYKPTTNSLRHFLSLEKALLCKNNRLVKSLQIGKKKFFGRSSQTGHITVRHKGGGHKNLRHSVVQTNLLYTSLCLGILYAANRNTFLQLNYNFKTKTFFKTLATNFIYPGYITICQKLSEDLHLGYRLPLSEIPTGTIIHSLSKLNKVNFIRSGGCYGQLLQKNETCARIKLASGKIITVNLFEFATIGSLSNEQANLLNIGKAGRSRYLGCRPTVRGIAMNPVDHPHGGRTNGGRPSVTPWGIPTKGKPTVKNKKYE